MVFRRGEVSTAVEGGRAAVVAIAVTKVLRLCHRHAIATHLWARVITVFAGVVRDAVVLLVTGRGHHFSCQWVSGRERLEVAIAASAKWLSTGAVVAEWIVQVVGVFADGVPRGCCCRVIRAVERWRVVFWFYLSVVEVRRRRCCCRCSLLAARGWATATLTAVVVRKVVATVPFDVARRGWQWRRWWMSGTVIQCKTTVVRTQFAAVWLW